MSTGSVMLLTISSSVNPFSSLPSIFLSIRVFSDESALHTRWPAYGSFSFSISPSNEYLGLISFRIDWSDILAVQGTLKSLLQHHTSKHMAGLIIFIMLYIVSPVLIYLVAGSLYLLTAFIQPSLHSTSGNRKSGLPFYESVCI